MSAVHNEWKDRLFPTASRRFTPDGRYDIAAGQERIRIARRAELDRADRMNKALIVLRQDCTTEADAVRALHAISAALVSTKPLPTTSKAETIELLDQTADEIQYRDQP